MSRAVDARRRRASRACLRGAGLDVPVGTSPCVRRGARRGRRRHDRASVYWAGRATLVRRPEDIADLRPRRSPCSGAAARSPSGAARARGRASTWLLDDRRRRRRRRPGDERPHGPTIDGAVQPARGAAPQGLRRRTRPTELAEARRLMADLRLAGALRRIAPAPTVAPRPRAGPTCAAPCATRPADRRRAASARVVLEPGARARVGSCCCATSADRWSRTPGRCCASPTPRSSAARRSRCSPSAPGSPGSPASCRRAIPTPRSAAAAERGRRLVGRHPARRRPARVQRRVGRAGHGPGRGRRDPVRRLGPRRPRRAGEQMARLQRVAHRVVWVNPLKASPGYAPLAAGHGRGPAVRRRVRRGPLARVAARRSAEVIVGDEGR